MIRVAIADDHELIRDGFAKLLSSEDDIRMVGQACTAAELFELLTKVTADVLVLDIGLPDKNGLEVLKELRVRVPHLRTLILSMHPEDRYGRRALAAGAAGYMTKDTASDELVNAIRLIYTRGSYISDLLAGELVALTGRPVEDLPHSKLSDREYELLLRIGEGLSIREISESLGLSINTVNSYRRRVLEKMELSSNADLIHYVLRHNLVE